MRARLEEHDRAGVTFAGTAAASAPELLEQAQPAVGVHAAQQARRSVRPATRSRASTLSA